MHKVARVAIRQQQDAALAAGSSATAAVAAPGTIAELLGDTCCRCCCPQACCVFERAPEGHPHVLLGAGKQHWRQGSRGWGGLVGAHLSDLQGRASP
jgi:hypothetical protein